MSIDELATKFKIPEPFKKENLRVEIILLHILRFLIKILSKLSEIHSELVLLRVINETEGGSAVKRRVEQTKNKQNKDNAENS